MQRCLPELIWSLEDLRLGQCYPNYYASKLASRFVKVCLSGTGGDELFAGYPWRYYSVRHSKNFDEYIDGYYKYWHRIVSNTTLKKLFSPIWEDVKSIWTRNIFKDVFKNNALPQTQEDYLNHSLYFEVKTFLHGLLIVDDKLSMAHSLEIRVPFLDNDLVDFAQKIPVSLKLDKQDQRLKVDEDEIIEKKEILTKMKSGKIILRKALGKYLDSELINQSKQGFSGPDASWFKGESIEYVKKILFDKTAKIYDYFDYKTTTNLINDHIDGRYNYRLFIWSLLCFEWWCRIWLNGDIRK